MRSYCVYIMASRRNGTLYVGLSSDLERRVWEHREGALAGFSRDHGTRRLVWYEMHEDVHEAILRERRIKEWRRAWKIRLIEEVNPEWRDLWWQITGQAG